MNTQHTDSTPAARTFGPVSGSYRTQDGKAQIDWKLRAEKKGLEFSASGTYNRGGGQCLHHIAKAYPSDSMVQRIAAVWSKWHLNGMRAGTPVQRALGWGHGFDVALSVNTMTAEQYAALESRNERAVSRKREAAMTEARAALVTSPHAQKAFWLTMFPERAFADYSASIVRAIAGKTHLPYGVTPSDAARVLTKLDGYLSDLAAKAHPTAPVASEIFPDSIGAPCPETGYLYGHSWLFEEIPADILAEIHSWKDAAPAAVGSLGDSLAESFLERNRVDCRIALSNTKTAPWSGGDAPLGRNHYRVTLSHFGAAFTAERGTGRNRLVFDWWGSKADAEARRNPSAYDILACISSDINTPETLKDFLSEFGGNADSIETRQTWRRASLFAKRLREFFSESERAELAEIS